MRYKLINTDENYIKVYPYSNSYYKATENDLFQIQSEIKRHVDDISNVEITQEKQYYFEDEFSEYTEDSLSRLCIEMAYQRDLINDHYSWTVEWFNNNNEKCCRRINCLEDLLDEVTKHKDINIIGDLTERESVLVDMAKLLCD